MRKAIDKIKQKWGLKSDFQFFIINLVFALAGMSVVFVRKPIFHLLHITDHTSIWIKIGVYIPIFFPTYQINLLIYGFLFGQFAFFWDKEKRLWGFLLGRFFKRASISR
jgi:hypothetical protein